MSILCTFIQGVLEHVRLMEISSEVFAQEVEPTGLLSMEMTLARYTYISSESQRKDMHSSFSVDIHVHTFMYVILWMPVWLGLDMVSVKWVWLDIVDNKYVIKRV